MVRQLLTRYRPQHIQPDALRGRKIYKAFTAGFLHLRQASITQVHFYSDFSSHDLRFPRSCIEVSSLNILPSRIYPWLIVVAPAPDRYERPSLYSSQQMRTPRLYYARSSISHRCRCSDELYKYMWYGPTYT
jgi:hypothetical protein